MNNDEKQIMIDLVALYEKCKDENGWAEYRDMISLSGSTRATMFYRMGRVKHLWNKEKKKVVVVVKPISNWDKHVQSDEDKSLFSKDEFALIAEMMVVLNDIENRVERLNKLEEIFAFTHGKEKYKGAYSDYREKLSRTKNIFKGMIE